MQFTPNKTDKYVSVLRLYTEKYYLKNGINEKLLKNLKKILLFGLLKGSNYKQSTDIFSFCNTVLGCAQVELLKKGYFFTSKITGKKIKNVNRNLLLAIICELSLYASQKSGEISVITDDNGIIIKTDCLTDSTLIKKFSKKAGGVYTQIKSRHITAIFIPENNTDNMPLSTPKEWQYLTDKLSPIKIMLSAKPDKHF